MIRAACLLLGVMAAEGYKGSASARLSVPVGLHPPHGCKRDAIGNVIRSFEVNERAPEQVHAVPVMASINKILFICMYGMLLRYCMLAMLNCTTG